MSNNVILSGLLAMTVTAGLTPVHSTVQAQPTSPMAGVPHPAPVLYCKTHPERCFPRPGQPTEEN